MFGNSGDIEAVANGDDIDAPLSALVNGNFCYLEYLLESRN